MATANRHTTLSELLSSVKEALVSSFSLPRWVTAEIGELHVNRSSGHCYLELIEKGGAKIGDQQKNHLFGVDYPQEVIFIS